MLTVSGIPMPKLSLLQQIEAIVARQMELHVNMGADILPIQKIVGGENCYVLSR